MAQNNQSHESGGIITLLLAAGVGYLAWQSNLLAGFGLPAPSTSTTTTGSTSIVTPASTSLAAGGVPSGTTANPNTTPNAGPSGQNANLTLYNATNYGDYFTNITGSSPSVQGETIGSIQSNGGNWILYSGPNYTGASVAISGEDFPSASSLLSSLGGGIGSVKYLGQTS
jgi:Beta/Gamma crystallin